MYVETECPVCNSREWINIGLDVTQTKRNAMDGIENIANYTIENVEVSETLSTPEFVQMVKKQIARKGSSYTDLKEMEADLIKCFGVAKNHTRCLLWQLQETDQKKQLSLDYILCSTIWFLEGLRTRHNRKYFTTGATASIIAATLLFYYFRGLS